MLDIQTLIEVSQAFAVSYLAAWLSIGVYENIRHPDLNRAYTSEVLEMARLRDAYPDVYDMVAYRRIASKPLQNMAFRLIVFAEATSVVLLWIGAIALFLGSENAQAFAVLGVLSFCTIWASFLIAGNWFCYWFCHEIAQNTHYQMLLWGLATLILVAVNV